MVFQGASADEIVMKDGTRIFGRVISVDESSVKYDGGLSLPIRVSRDEVEIIIFGKVTTRRANPSLVDPVIDREDDHEGTLHRTSDYSAVLIPFKGTVGRSPLAWSGYVRWAIDEYERQGIGHVIFEVESPGGLVADMIEIQEIVLEAQSSGMRVTFWTGEALSAAAMIAMSSRTIITKPMSRVGGAEPIFVNAEGKVQSAREDDAVDASVQVNRVAAKMRSFSEALSRMIAEVTGRNPAIMTAMEDTTAELWFHETEGYRGTPEVGSGWIQIDDPRSLMVLTGREANRYGIAAGMASNIEELESVLFDGEPILDLRETVMNEKTSEFQRLVELRRRRSDEFFSAYRAIFAAIYQYQTEARAWLGSNPTIIDNQRISDAGTARLGKCANQIRTSLRRMRRLMQEDTNFRNSIESVLDLDMEDLRRLFDEAKRLRQRTEGDLDFSFNILRVIEVDLELSDEDD